MSKTTFYSLVEPVRKILFSGHSKIKFIPSRRRVLNILHLFLSGTNSSFYLMSGLSIATTDCRPYHSPIWRWVLGKEADSTGFSASSSGPSYLYRYERQVTGNERETRGTTISNPESSGYFVSGWLPGGTLGKWNFFEYFLISCCSTNSQSKNSNNIQRNSIIPEFLPVTNRWQRAGETLGLRLEERGTRHLGWWKTESGSLRANLHNEKDFWVGGSWVPSCKRAWGLSSS